jgi:hypothetical protein
MKQQANVLSPIFVFAASDDWCIKRSWNIMKSSW